MSKSGIYKIKNRLNDKIYIGSTKNAQRRWNQHKSELQNSKHNNPHLQNAFDKYGVSNFKFSIVEKIKDVENLIDREQHYMDKLDPEYNIIPRANRHKFAEETKQKMSEAHKGREFSEEHKRNLSEAGKGREYSNETRQKMSKALSGENHPRYGKVGEKCPISKLTKKKVKVIKHLLNGDSFTHKQIAKMFGVSRSTISLISTGKSWNHVKI